MPSRQTSADHESIWCVVFNVVLNTSHLQLFVIASFVAALCVDDRDLFPGLHDGVDVGRDDVALVILELALDLRDAANEVRG